AMNGLLGAFVSAVSAILLRQNREAMPSGLYGYNGVVIGIMMAAFSAEGNFCWWLSLPNVFMCLLCLLVSSALSSVANRWGLIIFTLPFNIFGLSTHCRASCWQLFLSAPVGVGQVHGYDSPWTGSLILLALLLSSPTICFHAMLGSAAGMLSGFALAAPNRDIYSGLLTVWSVSSSSGKKKKCLSFKNVKMGFTAAFFSAYVNSACSKLISVVRHFLSKCLSYHVSPWFATCPFCLSALIFLLISSEIPAICRLSQSVVSYPEENQRDCELCEKKILRRQLIKQTELCLCVFLFTFMSISLCHLPLSGSVSPSHMALV
uniref:Urea transporter n=1 Tax=Echeneis naucrates TaxID=173247 RepID=A0A665W296_ECHNA